MKNLRKVDSHGKNNYKVVKFLQNDFLKINPS